MPHGHLLPPCARRCSHHAVRGVEVAEGEGEEGEGLWVMGGEEEEGGVDVWDRSVNHEYVCFNGSL